MGTIGLQDDETSVGLWAHRGNQKIHRHLYAGARLQCYEAPESIVNLVDVVHFLQQGLPRYSGCSADDHLADLALAVNFNQLDGVWPFHTRTHFRYQPQGWSLQ